MRRSRQPWEDLRGYRTLLRVDVEVVGTVALELSSDHLWPLLPLAFGSSSPLEVEGMQLLQEAEVKQTLTSEARCVVQRETLAHWKVTCCQKGCLSISHLGNLAQNWPHFCQMHSWVWI